MQKHVILTFVGLVLAVAFVAWLQTDDKGTAFVVVFTLLAVNAIGAIMIRFTKGKGRQQ